MKITFLIVSLVCSFSAFAADPAPPSPKTSEELSRSGEVPHFQNGKPAGYTKVPSHSDGKMESLGLKNGKIIHGVAPTPTSSPSH